MSDPWQIPESWQWSTMGEIAEVVGGGTPKTDRVEYFGGDIPWITPADLSGYTGKFISRGTRSITQSGLENSGAQLMPAGTVLFSSRAPIGYVAVAANPVTTSQGFKSFILATEIEPDYVYYYLQHARQLAFGLASGTTFLELSGKKAAQLPIPITNLNEQRRIVAEIEKQFTLLDAGVAALQRVQTNITHYRSALLKEVFEGQLVPSEFELALENGDSYESAEALLERALVERRQRWVSRAKYKEPVTPDTATLSVLPAGWIWASIDQIANVDLGKMLDKNKNHRGQQLPYLRNVNVRWRQIDTQNLREMFFEADEIERFSLKSGDLLVCEGGEPGRAAVWDGTISGMMYQKALHRVRFYSSFQPSYLLLYLEYLAKSGRLEQRFTGSLIKHFTREAFLSLPVPIPPFAEQTRIIAEVERRLSTVDEIEVLVRTNLRRADRLRQSLLQKAYSGNLVSPEPNQESVSELLARIHEAQDQQKLTRLKSRRTKLSTRDSGEDATTVTLTTKHDLQLALTKIEGKPSVNQLFNVAGFKRDEIYDFYDALVKTPDVVKVLDDAVGRGQRPIPSEQKEHAAIDERQNGHFRLHEIWIKKFRNLENYTIVFHPSHALDVLLGWNGTGKSNFFEALVIIFSGLYKWQTKNKWMPHEDLEGYHIRYEIEEMLVDVIWDSKASRPTVKICHEYSSNSESREWHKCSREELPLPHFLFGYYSGPSNRFTELFSESKQEHYDRLLKATSDDKGTLAQILSERRFFCAETHHAKYALLAFFYKDETEIRQFLQRRLRIEDLESVLFVLKRPRWHKNNDPEDFWGADGLLRPVLERLRSYSDAPMIQPQRVDDGYQESTRDHYFLFLPNKERLQEFASYYGDASSFFVALESTDFSSIIHDVRICIRINATATRQAVVTFNDMSEGEQQLLMVLGLLRFTKTNQSLILLDEPDTHLNPHWQLEYIRLLLDTLVGEAKGITEGKRTPIEELEQRLSSQILLSTHDPLAIADLLKENIHLFRRREQTQDCVSVPATENPRGMGFTGILTSEMFGLRSDLDEATLQLLDHHVNLVGKDVLDETEKKELQELTEAIGNLGFKSASSDPYYRAFLRALMRRKKTRELLLSPVLTKPDMEQLASETDAILLEIEQEDIRSR